jgi:hypothetical protein
VLISSVPDFSENALLATAAGSNTNALPAEKTSALRFSIDALHEIARDCFEARQRKKPAKSEIVV